MIGLLRFVLGILASPFKSKSRLEAENAVLRHQLIVLRRKLRGRVKLANSDRWFFIQLYRWFPSILEVLTTMAVLKFSVQTGVFAFGMAPTCRGALSSDAIAQRIGSL